MNHRLLGVVLCGGRSSRMGQDKASLPHPSGVSFAQHAADRLVGVCEQVCISGGTSRIAGVRRIEDAVRYRGPVTGIATALSYACRMGYHGCLVTPVDMPFLTSEDLVRLRQAWVTDSKLCCAVASASVSHEHEAERSGQLQPLVAVYPASLTAMLVKVSESEDRSLRRWIQTQDIVRVVLSDRSCRNINTLEELADADL